MTDWQVEGAVVVVWTDHDHDRYHNVLRTRVDKVTADWFTVDGAELLRFPLAECEAREGGPHGWWWRVAPVDSDQARTAEAASVSRRRTDDALRAVQTWTKNRTKASRMAAITALQAIEMDREDLSWPR